MTATRYEDRLFPSEGLDEELASVYETELEALSSRCYDSILANGGDAP